MEISTLCPAQWERKLRIITIYMVMLFLIIEQSGSLPGRNTEAAPGGTRLGRNSVRSSTPDLPLNIMTQSTDVHACCVNPVSYPHVLLI